jgi:hypothetical protein
MADTQQFGGKIKPFIPFIGFIIGFISFQLLFHLVIKSNKPSPKSISELQVDSLNKVVDSLQTEIFYLEDGFDHKEHIYEQVIYDCEHGKNHRETLKRLEINE